MSKTRYDSRPETYEHIAIVRGYLLGVVMELLNRAHEHDSSKLHAPEREMFDKYTLPTTYASDEYKTRLEEMGEALQHHYAVNRHHPEFHENGIEDMTLVDILEMLSDWAGAVQRHSDGDLERSIYQNAERFGYGPEMTRLLLNTAREFGWLANTGHEDEGRNT